MQPHPLPSTSHSQRTSSRQASLTSIVVPPLSALKPPQHAPSASPVRRKPLPANASPVTRNSSADVFQTLRSNTARIEERQSKRSFSVDSPSAPQPPFVDLVLPPPDSSTLPALAPKNLDEARYNQAYAVQQPAGLGLQLPSSKPGERPRHERSYSSYHTAHDSIPEETDLPLGGPTPAHFRSQTMSYFGDASKQNLETQAGATLGDQTESTSNRSPPRKPGTLETTLNNMFAWNRPRQTSSDQSSVTTFSERSRSPSPMSRKKADAQLPAPKATLTALDIPKANGVGQPTYFNVPGTPLLSNSPGMNAHVEVLEYELRQISSELAESIRREMELEDEIERWKAELPTSTTERRTSDYYSDSGASSTRYPFGDSESKLDELEKLRRKAEQEKAQLRKENATRVQEELRRRRDLEAQVQQLEEKIQTGSQGTSDTERVRELEMQLEDARRRLADERQLKDNFEDLFTALQKEIEQHRNERDNLRDEVVPSLKAQVEGLEAQAAESSNATYEVTRMQQELETLRSENSVLLTGRKGQNDGRFRSIAEEEDSFPSPPVGLSRSNSLARHSGTAGKRSSFQLSRSNSIKEKVESKDPLSDRVKDIEEQRDALHRALKSLLARQEAQAKEHHKRIRILEMERDAALNVSPRRTGFHREVTQLRNEVNALRRKADDALEQKWQCEKGLGGLRMDLDRAEQETAGLRNVLQEHYLTVPDLAIDGTNLPSPLEKSFTELKTTHALSLARLRDMSSDNTAADDADTTLQLLKRSISDAETERDAAHREAESYRQQARALQQSELAHLNKEQSLASELFAAAKRMDDLSQKVQQQLGSNRQLRDRLTQAVSRGEQEQKASSARIVELERRLKAEEDRLLAAQNQSDDIIARHEEDLRELKKSQNEHLQRMKPLSAGSRNASHSSLLLSPRLDQTTSGPGMSIGEATKANDVQQKVADLEKALRDADNEMSMVVGRMNEAQIEVFQLQTERDEAIRQTKKLQAEMQAEREKVKALVDA